MFEFAGKMHNPKMHQVQRPKEPGREKSPPIVFNEKNCLGEKFCVCLIVLSLDKCSVCCEIFCLWRNILSLVKYFFLGKIPCQSESKYFFVKMSLMPLILIFCHSVALSVMLFF